MQSCHVCRNSLLANEGESIYGRSTERFLDRLQFTYIPELTASYWMGKSRRLTKANLTKVRDAKPRVLASSEKPWKTSRRTQDRRAADEAEVADEV
jgi:hypothetical protein